MHMATAVDWPTSHLSTSDLESFPPKLRLLLGEDAGQLLAAVAEAAGGELASWRPRQVDHQPGRFTVVQYRTQVTWPKGNTTSETFVAASGERIPDAGAAVFDDGENRVAAWRWTNDPFLPGISDALDPIKVASLLDDLGVDGGSVQLRTRAYRPARRAVIEATGRRGRLFLKVIRPGRVEDLHDTHRLLATSLPVPETLGWTDRGVLVLTARPGETLRKALRSSRQPPPGPQAVLSLLDRLPSELARRPPRRDLVSSAEHHATVITATVPSMRDRLEILLDTIRAMDDLSVTGPVPVHGDLYEAQLLVNRGRITGLLDVDTAGAGLRIDDLANFCAHLSVLAAMSDRPRHIKRYGSDLLAHAEQHHPPQQLRPRVAAAVIGLATGPFRVLDNGWEQKTLRRLGLAEEWLNGLHHG
jgi:hypothetical protein